MSRPLVRCDAPYASAEASAEDLGARGGAQVAQLTADLEAEKRRRIAAEEKAAKVPDADGDAPTPASHKQMESLKRRIGQLEGELATANARQPATAAAHSSSHTPPPSTLGDWNGTDASAAEYYQYQYSSASDNVAVLALLVQEAVGAHHWPAAGSRKVLRYGQPHGPMARFAGKLIIRMFPPRVVAMLWWEYLMFICAAWFSCVVGIAYFHGILLDDYPAVLLTPFIPSVIAFIVRLCYTMPLNATDGPRFVLNLCHIVAVPLAFVLLFLKMWNDLGSIDWWIVAVIPAGVLTRAVVDQLWAVVMEIPKTEYSQLGYGREGGAFEYAFSEPQDDDVEIVEERVSSRKKPTRSSSGGGGGGWGRLASGDSRRKPQPTSRQPRDNAEDTSYDERGWAGAGEGRTSVDSVRVSLDDNV